MFGQIFGAFWGGILGGVIWGKKLPFLNNFHILTIHFRLTLPQFFVPIILSTVMCVLLYPSFMSKHAVFAEKLVIFLPCLISVSRVRQGRGFTVGGDHLPCPAAQRTRKRRNTAPLRDFPLAVAGRSPSLSSGRRTGVPAVYPASVESVLLIYSFWNDGCGRNY